MSDPTLHIEQDPASPTIDLTPAPVDRPARALVIDLTKTKHKYVKKMRQIMTAHQNGTVSADSDMFADVICALDPSWTEEDVDELYESEVLSVFTRISQQIEALQKGTLDPK